ncbi:MAG TPA: SDR family NAD(P)-dependent oxidoreductase [Caulobacterales bacterium]|nr:SDR family NAD(P)-dependent oxidoreductase [Caulobacterales bacterium]
MTDNELRAQIPALASGGCAVITGAANGIGLAAAKRFALMGVPVLMADLGGHKLDHACAEVAGETNSDRVLATPCDVSVAADLDRLAATARDAFGAIGILMNNAAIGDNPGSTFAKPEAWRKLIDINLFGVINGVQAFAPMMIEQESPSLIINTGSKQGITMPPGNAAYNVSKAGVKVFTEALAHELRNTPQCKVAAHLLIPGFTFTGMTSGDRTEKPAAAWTPEQVVDFMLESIARGDFYILCPDNDVTRAMDEKRMAWAIGDIIENRPALSRWHPDYADAFAHYMRG